MTRWTCCWYMVHVRKLTRKHDRGVPNGQLPGLDWQSLPRPSALAAITFGPHRSALSALKKSLVANLSAKRQLSVAKLSTERIFSPAKRDFSVANGRMAADFSSPGTCTFVIMYRFFFVFKSLVLLHPCPSSLLPWSNLSECKFCFLLS